MTFGAACALVSSVLGIVPYVAITEIARVLVRDGTEADHRQLLVWAGIAVGSQLLKQLFSQAGLGAGHLVEARFRGIVRQRLAAHLQKVPLGWFTRHSSGEIRKVMIDDVNAVHTLVAHAGTDVTAGIAGPVFGLVYLFVVDWRMALVLLLWLLVLFGVVAVWLSRSPDLFGAFYEAEANMSSASVEIVDGIAEVKNYGLVGEVFERFDEARTRYSAISYEWLQGMARPTVLLQAAIMPAVMAIPILGMGLVFTGQGWSEPVDILPFLMLGIGLPSSLYSLLALTQHLNESIQSARKLTDVLASPPLAETASPAEIIGNDIRVDNLTFGYDEDFVLHDVNLSLPAGSMTALVGPSGSGKTTLARLIARFWDPVSGSIQIGGVDLRDVSSAELLRRVALVFQDVALLRTSVHDNIALARPDASRHEVEQAARAAQIHERIVELPHGYDTVLEQEGAHLSGGEAQRVTIARAILADAPVLILDEATAYADPHSEHLIRQALSALQADRTVLVIAHRLASIRHADQIVVLDHGRVVEGGTHEELLRAGSTYSSMWNAQHVDEQEALA
ncbi:MAG TPA: ABC transporter ATP-binding protein [Actinomycetaceae bacterium]|nr:ABC transporter ATP-binding protein [Actinomycetaceae bacterium]